MKEKNRVIIIGGGASGLFAAITAAEHGAEVVVLEKEKKAGRKILKTGNGRCNFTNTGDPSHSYHGTDREFARHVLALFTPQDTIAKFTAMGIYTTNKSGWIYPHSETAESVLTLLLWRLEELHVKVKCNETVTGIDKKNDVFTVFTKSWHYEADKVILACGSVASLTDKQLPYNGYDLIKRAGHTCISPLPALVPLKVKNGNMYKWGGVRTNASVSLYAEDIFIAKSSGQLQLTDFGISGIPVFAISGQALRLLEGGLKVSVRVDFFPELSDDALCALLRTRRAQHPDRSTANLLTGLLPERLIHAVSTEAEEKSGFHDRTANGRHRNSNIPERETAYKGAKEQGLCGCDEIRILAETIKAFDVVVTGSQGFAYAQSVSGGIPTGEVSADTCESKKMQGLYLTGEILDIDGECGGWNLQFAWSTGYLAGKHAAEAL